MYRIIGSNQIPRRGGCCFGREYCIPWIYQLSVLLYIKFFNWGVCPRGLRATGRARGRGPRAGQQFRGSGPRARERARERDQRHPARPGREHRRARRAAAAVKARRTPQDPLWSPKSPSPPRPPVRPAGVFLKFLTFGAHICFHRYLVGAAARGISTLESNPRRGGDDPQSYPAPARGWALQPVSRGTSPCLAS